MATPVLPTPSQIQQNWLTYLANLKPNLNVNQQDSDWWIRGAVVGGVLSGVYADNLNISNDAFPQNARQDAIAQWLQTLFGNSPVYGNFLPATQAQGYAAVTGNPGQVVALNLQAVYQANGNTYNVSQATTLDPVAGTGLVPFISVATGQAQNLFAGAILNFPSPPAGLNATAVVASAGFTDAVDPESLTAARNRVLTRLQNPLSVGRVTDYEQYAAAASPSVTSVTVDRFIYGPGTVGVYITSGTNDIDAAVDAGQSINPIPSQQLINTVQDYLDYNSPDTDCVYVLAPNTLSVNVTVQVSFAQGNGSTVLSGQTLTQAQLVQREVQRAIYKTPVGGRILGSSGGFLVASDIEQGIDLNLSGEPTETGTLAILTDRQVLPLSASGYNLSIATNQVVIPGTITVLVI